MKRLYYTAPKDEQFNELKKNAIKLWKTISKEPNYLQEKLGRINISNNEDNFMYIVAMFDMSNQRKLFKKLSEETKQAIRERMIDGEANFEYLNSLDI